MEIKVKTTAKDQEPQEVRKRRVMEKMLRLIENEIRKEAGTAREKTDGEKRERTVQKA